MQIVVSNGKQRKRLNLPCSDAELNAAVKRYRDKGYCAICQYLQHCRATERIGASDRTERQSG